MLQAAKEQARVVADYERRAAEARQQLDTKREALQVRNNTVDSRIYHTFI